MRSYRNRNALNTYKLARPKSYDRDNAIKLACMAFWDHGYQALGVRELEKLTGLNQFAIRTEFGGKQGLFREALKFYCDQAIESEMKPLIKGGVPEITTFIRGLVTDGSMTSSSSGCLVVNTGIENARIKSPILEEAVTKYWKTLEKRFVQALRNAQNLGEISEEIDIQLIASGLVTAVMGVHSKNRSNQANKAGRALVKIMCDYLNSLK